MRHGAHLESAMLFNFSSQTHPNLKPDLTIAFCVIWITLAGGCSSGGGGGSGSTVTAGTSPPPVTPVSPLGSQTVRCENGMAGEYACSGVALRSRVSVEAMEGSRGNDIWGWVDAQTDREYALMGMTNGTAFVDITDPESPQVIGLLPTQAGTSYWRDIKVFRDHAYVVADNAGAHGMQVFDLTRLRDAVPPETFMPDIVYVDFEYAHNLAINEDTGYAYAVGSDTCGHGLHIIDIRTPNNPLFAGCHSTVRTHDTQCVVYRGPDAGHRDREICVSSNEDHIEVVDVTLKSAPVTLSSTVYDELGFVHQGWLTEDHRFFFLGDEFDEISFGVPTRTLVFDLTDLDSPRYVYTHEAATASTDHNLYVAGNRVFQANYSSGLRILEFDDPANRDLREIAWFDTYPEDNAEGFEGAWSVYPYLPSGVIIVSDQTNGLFVLSLQ